MRVSQPLPVLAGPPTLETLTLAWLWSFRESEHTRQAYRRDVAHFLAWCTTHGIVATAASRPQLDAYAAMCATERNPVTGKTPAASSVARRLSALSSWYAYLVDSGVAAANPVAKLRRPRVDRDHTATVGLTAAEAIALRRAAATDPVLGPAGSVLAGFLLELGARVSEACAAQIEDLGHDRGHRTVVLRMKGGKTRTRAIPPGLAEALTRYLAGRTEGPLFLNPGGGPLDRHTVARFVRRCAYTAGLPAAGKISPHSLRHAWATIAREHGASLEERQYALGHADPRTTQRYDRARTNLDRDPAYLVAGAVSEM
jgi:site-specific recombinase XerD